MVTRWHPTGANLSEGGSVCVGRRRATRLRGLDGRPITVWEDPTGPVHTLIAPVDQMDEVGPALARGGLRNTWLPP